MPTPPPTTLRLRIYWSYANLAMAHAAVSKGAATYGRSHYMIRAKLYRGLHSRTMNMRSLLDDERLKMNLPRCCAYCGDPGKLSLDHLLPRHREGPDRADNIVWACRSCNSSKGQRDVLVWWPTRDAGPIPLLLVRRYLKLALILGDQLDVLDRPLDALPELPFTPDAIPVTFPPPTECRLWTEGRRSQVDS